MKTFILMCLFMVGSLWAQGIFNGNNTNDGELTAQEEHEAGNYIHQGIAQQNYQDICSGKHDLTKDQINDDGEMSDICTNGENAFEGNWRILESMMPVVNQAYSMIGVAGMMGGGSSMLPTNKIVGGRSETVFIDGEGNELSPTGKGDSARYDVAGTPDNPNDDLTKSQMNESDDYEKKTEEQKDMCALIPGVTDLAANTMQGMENQQIQQSVQAQPTAPQAESFYALARSQRSRKKTSNTQMYGWGATAGCYTAYWATGSMMDLSLGIKLGLSVAAATFYGIKAKHHGDKADLLDKLGDSFNKAGECNPHTDTQCFCNEESSVVTDLPNYQKYCIPEAYVHKDKPMDQIVSCIDAQGKPDPECKCKKRRACIDATISKEAIRVGLNPTVMNDATGGLTPFANGFADSNLGPGLEQTLAMAKKALKSYKPKKIPSLRGNKKAQKMAKELAKLGIPKGLSTQIAATKFPNSGSTGLPAFAASDLAQEFGNKTAAFSKGVRNDPKFKSGGSVRSGKSGGSENPFAFSRGGASKGKGGVQIGNDLSSLANKAAMDADITKDSSRGIFDILSHRYKIRAWKEFEDTMTKEVE